MRFGVLGTGFWAKEIHAASLAAHPDAELVGVWGRDVAKSKAVGAEFDVPGFGDVDELLSRVDAVSIALPPDVQAPLAEGAAAAGRPGPPRRPPPRRRQAPAAREADKSTRLNSSHTLISYAVFWSSDVCSRSEEHTSELQSHSHLVCRLLLEKKTT